MSQSVPEGATFSVVFKDEYELEVVTVRFFSNYVSPVGWPHYSPVGGTEDSLSDCRI
jgi:hypothetical protein